MEWIGSSAVGSGRIGLCLGKDIHKLTYCVSNRLEVSRQGCRSHENFMTKYGADLGRLSSQRIVHGNHPRVVVNSAAHLI